MQLGDISALHVELSSKCNAWCPGCPRNFNGYGLRPNVNPTNLELIKLYSAFDKLPNLTRVQLCGRFGDPLMHNDLFQVVETIVSKKYHLQIHTNGSLRNVEWWSNLGNLLKNHSHQIWFGLDGLEDTHSLYRQATDFNKVIENASAFIKHGGHAIWQFIPFKHNEHQVKDCIKLAKKLGFKNFEIIEGVRNPTSARNYITGEEYELLPWSKTSELNYREYAPKLVYENCAHLMAPGLYITASGKYTLCCHFDSVYPEYDSILYDTIEETVPLDIEYEIKTTPRPLCVKACANLRMPRKLLELNT